MNQDYNRAYEKEDCGLENTNSNVGVLDILNEVHHINHHGNYHYHSLNHHKSSVKLAGIKMNCDDKEMAQFDQLRYLHNKETFLHCVLLSNF